MVLLDAAEQRRHLVAGFALAALVTLLDQLTKLWVLATLGEAGAGGRIIRLTGFFDLLLVWNRGVSFGLFNNAAALNRIIFPLIAAAIVVALVVWLRRAANRWLALGIGLVIGGAIGNVIDRLRLGAVVDFLDFHVGGWHYPAFNLADSAICVGVGMMLIDGLLRRREAIN